MTGRARARKARRHSGLSKATCPSQVREVSPRFITKRSEMIIASPPPGRSTSCRFRPELTGLGPSLIELESTLAKFGPDLVELKPNLMPECARGRSQVWPNSGQTWPDFEPQLLDFGPDLTDPGPVLVGADRSRAKCGQSRAKSGPKIGRDRPNFGQRLAKLAQRSGTVGPISTGVGGLRPHFGQIRPGFGQHHLRSTKNALSRSGTLLEQPDVQWYCAGTSTVPTPAYCLSNIASDFGHRR